MPEDHLIANIRVFGSVEAVTDLMRGQRQLTREESFRLETEVARVKRALSIFQAGFQDELSRDEMMRLDFWQKAGRSQTIGIAGAAASGFARRGNVTKTTAQSTARAPEAWPAPAPAAAPATAQ